MEVMRRKTVLLAMPLAMAGDDSGSRGWGRVQETEVGERWAW